MFFIKMSSLVERLIEDIHQHPFNLQLSNGTLPTNTFIHYLQQDALYLAEFSRALALASAKLPKNEHAQQFLDLALQTVVAEKELHHYYLKQYQSTTKLIAEQSPACFGYTNYILKMASLASVEEAVAALLPCFWVYREVGNQIKACATETHNPYQDWIQLYSSESFNQSVECIIQITNEIADLTSHAIRDKMCNAFVRSTQLEWLFWDGAYHKTTWPC